MQKAFAGFAKMGVVLSLLVIFVILSLYMLPVFGADFNSVAEDDTVEAGAANVQLNFTINNTDASKNITEVNITVPGAFTYIENSNITSANDTSFSNSSVNLTWINTTDNGFVENGTVEYFLFNVSVPTLLGNYTFTISTVDTDDVFNSTTLNITVVDTTAPENITLVPPTLSNNSRTPNNWTYVNVTFDEIHPSNCTLEFNQTYNYSMTRNGIYCYYNVNELNDGTHSYTIYVNDTSNNSGSNGTFYITVDTTPPQITIDYPQNTTYYTGAIDYNITLNENLTNASVSIDGGANMTMTNDTAIHFYNLSGNHPNLTEGYHNARFWANDTVGNPATSNVNFTVIIPVTAGLFFNVTYLNSTDHAVGLNDTIRIYVEDNDTVSNNVSVNDTVEVIITSSECSITLTLNESDVHTGNFSLLTDGMNASFNFSTGGCSNTTRTLQVNASMHNNISLSYTDPRNGTGDAAAPIINTTMVDTLVPQVVSVATADDDVVYMPGETININLTLDQAGGNISANFSTIDDGWVADEENVTELDNGSYLINYTISTNTNRTDGFNKVINITMFDKIGNGPAYTTFNVALSRITANTTLIDFSVIAPGNSNAQAIDITNNGTVNQTGVSESFEVYRERDFTFITSTNASRTFYFMVMPGATKLMFNLTSNDSSAQLSSALYTYSDALESSSLNGIETSASLFPATETRVWKWRVGVANVTSDVAVAPEVRVYHNATGWFNSTLLPGNYFEASSNTTINITLTIPETAILPYKYGGSVTYSNANISIEVNLTFNITAPQLWVESNASGMAAPARRFPQGGTLEFKVNRGIGLKMWELRVNNTGDANMTGVVANITQDFIRDATTNMSLHQDNITGGSGVTVTSLENISMGTIENGSSKLFAITMNASNHSTGVYTSFLNLTTANGQPHNYSNLTLTINITDWINVTVLSTTFGGTSSIGPEIGDNVSLNVSVRYQTGEPISGLPKNNFTVFDLSSTVDPTPTITGFVNTSSDGTYILNFTAPSLRSNGQSESGTHNLRVQVEKNESANGFLQNINEGNGSSNYTLAAAKIEVDAPSTITMYNGTSEDKDFVITNYGMLNATNVTTTIWHNGSASKLTIAGGNTTISALNTSGHGNEVEVEVNFTASSSSSIGTYLVTMNVTYNDSGLIHYHTDTVIIRVIALSNGGNGNGDPGGNDNGGDETTSLEISDYDSAINITLGEYREVEVDVENTGDTALIAVLEAAINSGINASVDPENCVLSSGEECTFDVNFTVSENTTTGDHAGTYTAEKSTDSDVSDTASFTITVLPTEERKSEINTTYEECADKLANLTTILNGIKARGLIPIENITAVELLLNESLDLIEQIEAAISGDDYITAESLLRELQTLTARIETEINALLAEEGRLSQGVFGSYTLWIAIIIVIVAAVILLYYTLMPPKSGYHVKYGYKTRGQKSLALYKQQQEKDRFVPQEKYAPLRGYGTGYERPSQARYGYKQQGAFSKLKNIFKRKEREQREQRSLSYYSQQRRR